MIARAGVSLLEHLHGIIEKTYGMRTGIRRVGDYVLGDEGYRKLYAGSDVLRRIDAGDGRDDPGPRVLLRLEGAAEGLRASLYYPDDLVRRLEASPPTRGIDESNIDDFAVFVEELDHLLCVADRVAEGKPFSLLELELHAEVTKYLAAALFVARGRPDGRLGEGDRVWLRYQLFEKRDFSAEDPELRDRYRDAARGARRFLGRIEKLVSSERIDELRRFHASSHQQKMALLD